MSDLLDLPRYDPDHWQNRAQCFLEGVDPDRMAPEMTTPEQLDEAKAVCARCPVRLECLESGREQAAAGGAFGLWGGEWFGRPPRMAGSASCDWCGEPIEASVRGAQRRFCDDNCRHALRRARLREAVPA